MSEIPYTKRILFLKAVIQFLSVIRIIRKNLKFASCLQKQVFPKIMTKKNVEPIDATVH